MSVIGCHQDITSPVITYSVCGLEASVSLFVPLIMLLLINSVWCKEHSQ